MIIPPVPRRIAHELLEGRTAEVDLLGAAFQEERLLVLVEHRDFGKYSCEKQYLRQISSLYKPFTDRLDSDMGGGSLSTATTKSYPFGTG